MLTPSIYNPSYPCNLVSSNQLIDYHLPSNHLWDYCNNLRHSGSLAHALLIHLHMNHESHMLDQNQSFRKKKINKKERKKEKVVSGPGQIHDYMDRGPIINC